MITDTVMTEEQLIRQATNVLFDKLGITETTRFLAIKHHGRLESVERHRLWQSQLDKDTFFNEVFNPENSANL